MFLHSKNLRVRARRWWWSIFLVGLKAIIPEKREDKPENILKSCPSLPISCIRCRLFSFGYLVFCEKKIEYFFYVKVSRVLQCFHVTQNFIRVPEDIKYKARFFFKGCWISVPFISNLDKTHIIEETNTISLTVLFWHSLVCMCTVFSNNQRT